MKAAVFGQKARDIRLLYRHGGFDGSVAMAQFRQLRRGGAASGAGGGMAFQHGAQGKDFSNIVTVPIGNHQATAGGAHRVELHLQPAQCIANRGARHADDIGQRLFAQRRAGAGIAGQDQAPDFGIGAIGGAGRGIAGTGGVIRHLHPVAKWSRPPCLQRNGRKLACIWPVLYTLSVTHLSRN